MKKIIIFLVISIIFYHSLLAQKLIYKQQCEINDINYSYFTKPVQDLSLVNYINEHLDYYKTSFNKNPAYIYRVPFNRTRNNRYPNILPSLPDTLFDIRIDNYYYINKWQALPDSVTEEELYYFYQDIINNLFINAEVVPYMNFNIIQDSLYYDLLIQGLKYEHNNYVMEFTCSTIINYAHPKWIKKNTNKIIQIMRNHKSIGPRDTLDLFPFLNIPKHLKDSLLKNEEIYKYYLGTADDGNNNYAALARMGDKYAEAKLIRKYQEAVNKLPVENDFYDFKDCLDEMVLAGSKQCTFALIKSLDNNYTEYKSDNCRDIYNPPFRFHVLMALYRLFPDEPLFNRELAKIIENDCNDYDKYIQTHYKYYEKVRNWAYKNYGIKLTELPYKYVLYKHKLNPIRF